MENDFKGFEVYYQPIMKPQTNTLYGSEALIRWHSEKYGFMSPVDFVPLLEESALITRSANGLLKMRYGSVKHGFRFIRIL